MIEAKYFTEEEFLCPCCGAGVGEIDPRLVYLLDKMRRIIGEPIIVLSGFRCVKHNRECHGVEDSQHLYGKAADIYCPSFPDGSLAVDTLAWIAEAIGVEAIGRYYDNNFVHLDTRGTWARWEQGERDY